MNPTARRVEVLGGRRIPFAGQNGPYAQASNQDMLSQNGPYAQASNQDMLTGTLDALAGAYGLEGETVGEVA